MTPRSLCLALLLTTSCSGSIDGDAPAPENDAAPSADTGAPTDSGTASSDASPNDASSTDTMATDDAAPPTDDLGFAQAFLAPLRLGVNVERGWAWSLPGDPTGSTDYWSYLAKTARVTHVRLFYPWRPSLDMGGGSPGNAPPDKARFDRILDGAAQAMKAGLKVFLDCTDVMGIEDFTGDNGKETETHMANCAEWVAARGFDPKMFALGPVNEWAGGDDNTTYNAYRKHFHEVLRSKLPGYVLTTGPAYWKSRDWIYDESKKFETFDDMRVVYEWHEYSSLDGPGWKGEEAKLAAWRKAHGDRPTVCGEAGAGYWGDDVDGTPLDRSPGAWPARFAAMLPAIAKERPSIWAITYGNSYRLNKSADDAHVMDGSDGQPNLLKMLQDGSAAISAAAP